MKKNLPRGDDRVKKGVNRPIASFTASTSDPSFPSCSLCKTEKHSLFACPQFKTLAHEKRMSVVKSNDLCVNCLRPGHFVKQCRSSNRCRKCQKSHHTLLHVDQSNDTPLSPTPSVSLTSNTSPETTPGSLLMTCRVLSRGPDGSSIESRALLDSASSISFVSERLRLYVSHDFVEMPRYMVSQASPMTLIVSLSLTLLFLPCRNLPRRSM